MSIQAGFPELLRRSRGSGRRLRLIRLARGRGCSRFLFLRRHLLVMALVLRFGLSLLSGFGLRRSSLGLCRGGGGLRGVLCRYRQRPCKHGERPEDNSNQLPGFHSILLMLPGIGRLRYARTPTVANGFPQSINRSKIRSSPGAILCRLAHVVNSATSGRCRGWPPSL